jgi:hypothetical protein
MVWLLLPTRKATFLLEGNNSLKNGFRTMETGGQSLRVGNGTAVDNRCVYAGRNHLRLRERERKKGENWRGVKVLYLTLMFCISLCYLYW